MGPIQDFLALLFLGLLGVSALWMWATGQLAKAQGDWE